MSTPASLQGVSVKDVASLAVDAAGLEPLEVKAEGLAAPVIAIKGQLQSLESFGVNPIRKRLQDKVVITEASFVQYVNMHKEEGTQLWAGSREAKVYGVIDDHSKEVAGWREHRIILDLQADPDWTTWMGLDGKLLSQDEFCDKLKDLGHTVTDPDAAGLQDIIRKFEATSVRKFERPVYDEVSGSVKFAYEDDAQQKGTIKLPSVIGIAVACFRGSVPVHLAADLRWRLKEGAVFFGVKFTRPDKIRDEAFQMVLDGIHSDTELMPLVCP